MALRVRMHGITNCVAFVHFLINLTKGKNSELINANCFYPCGATQINLMTDKTHTLSILNNGIVTLKDSALLSQFQPKQIAAAACGNNYSPTSSEEKL